MAEQPQSIPSPSMDLPAIRSRLEELTELHKRCTEDISDLNSLDQDKLLHDSALDLETRIQQIVTDCSEVGSLEEGDIDAYLEQLKEEHSKVVIESSNMAEEIERLTKMHVEDSIVLEAKLEELKYCLDHTTLKDLNTARAVEGDDAHIPYDNQSTLTTAHEDSNLELLELDNKIDEMKSTVKSLQDVKHLVERLHVVEQIEDALMGLKVLAFDENCIRLSLRTYLPNLNAADVNHELLIEVLEGTTKLKNIQIFPNDIYVSDIVDTAKSLSNSSLQWLVRKVQDRIMLSSLRRLAVKDADKLRYSIEYLDKDETIVAHLAGGIDAFIRFSHKWPLFGPPLKLISLKQSDKLKEISLSFLCKVEKLANSSDPQIRQNIPSFVDAIEKILIEQMQSDLHADESLAHSQL